MTQTRDAAPQTSPADHPDPHEQFRRERLAEMAEMAGDEAFRSLSRDWMAAACANRYSYNFTWLGRPIIQFPQDIVAMQEIIWKVRPQAIVETGIARGGSILFSASLLEMLGGRGKVVGVDIDIRSHNRQAIETHPHAGRVEMIEGSSVDPAIVARVFETVGDAQPVVVALDSNHTHQHVLDELNAYAPLVRKGSYLVVFDTVVEHVPAECCTDRPWGPGDNPATAVREFLARNDRFVVDEEYDRKLQITAAPGGYLRCVRDPD
jgi:cephalosporin hydroxylase